MTAAFHFEAKKYALRQAKDGVIVSFVVHPDDVVAELLSAPIGEHYVVALAPYTEQGPPSSTGSEHRVTDPKVGGSSPSADTIHHERRPFHSPPRSQQSAIACRDPRFVSWAVEDDESGAADEVSGPAALPEVAANYVRRKCGVSSRRDLDANADAGALWDALYARYLPETGQLPEPRG